MQVVLAEYGLGAAALYYLAPALLGGFVGSLRGYAGEVTAAQALDLLGSDGSAVLIDLRTEVRPCSAQQGAASLCRRLLSSWAVGLCTRPFSLVPQGTEKPQHNQPTP